MCFKFAGRNTVLHDLQNIAGHLVWLHAQVNVKGFNNVRVVVKTFSFAELKEKIKSAQRNDEAAIS